MNANGTDPDDVVQSAISQWCASQFGRDLGFSRELADLQWSDEIDDDDPYVNWEIVDASGRRFEVEIDVQVTELTDEVLAKRAELEKRLRELQAKARATS